ncbi:MAG: hypothetical protein E7671_00560 [Ruminococcaceae bacterium]|nr:hypothetical protein [Oscillospiraceae bacterium]
MSNVYSSSGNKDREIWIDDIGATSLDRVTKILAGIPGGAKKAIGSALKRASSSGEAFAARAVRSEYHIGASDFKEYTKSSKQISATSAGTEVSIKYHGTHIPLVRFDTHYDKDGKVVSRVKRSSARETLNNAFTAMFGGVVGIYERKGDARFPLRQLYGPATPQMMDANDDVSESIANHMRETFDKRIEHEMLRVMNGWEGKQ